VPQPPVPRSEVETGALPAGSGRPRATSRRAIEMVALDLFDREGFEATTVEDISVAAGVSKRTFFRYFTTKADVLWAEFDQEIDALRDLLTDAPADATITECVKRAVLAANHYGVDDVAELRSRMHVINSNASTEASASRHYDAWAAALAEFAARRLGQRPDDLIPRAIGLSALAVARAAFEQWLLRSDADLITYLDEALTAWQAGFPG
jgi:mycofactocin system transcriptional regulator